MNKAMFAQLFKIDEAKHEVWGTATEEVEDSSGETFNYEASKVHFKSWSQRAEEVTDGVSKGNIRYMHQLDAVGRVVDIQFDDTAKRISIGAKIVDDGVWKKIVERVLTGFSIGGRVVSWVGKKFECAPVEISVVDLPCLSTAVFQVIKADGSVETYHQSARIAEVIKGGSMSWIAVQKAARSMAEHFRKSADNHKAMATCHKDMGADMSVMAAAHDAMADDKDKDDEAKKAGYQFHKSMASACKAMAERHDTACKAHTAQSEAHGQSAAGCEAEEKAAKLEVEKAAGHTADIGEDMFTKDELQKAVADGMADAFKAQAAEAAKGIALVPKVVTPEDVSKAVEDATKAQETKTVELVTKTVTESVTKAVADSIAALDVSKLVNDKVTELVKAAVDDAIKAKEVATDPIPLSFSLIPRGTEVAKAAGAGAAAPLGDDDSGL